MKPIETYIRSLFKNEDQFCPEVYPLSLNSIHGDYVFMIKGEDEDKLVVTGETADLFQGITTQFDDMTYKTILLTHETGNQLRKLFPFTKPIKVLDKKRSFGLGDRLGIAGPGHLEVFKKYDAYPVLAQQSIRELNLTNRTYEDVLDAASFSVYKQGYKDGFGADGDHLKKTEEIEYALRLGFTMITLDCSDYIDGRVMTMSDEEILSKGVLSDDIKARYLNQTFTVGEQKITFDELALKKSVMIYQDAIQYAIKIYNTYLKDGKANANFEVSIDETGTPTTPTEHYYVANELSRVGVKLDTMAPRFCGEFQKGVDYVGDIKQFEAELIVHVAIAEHFGYKLSIHSGSDKFSIFTIIGKQTKGHFHVKTAGTNWLEAMRVVALKDPSLYRQIHAYALSRFSDAKQFYHVTTDVTRIPDLSTLKDEELPNLFTHNDSRQLIHITYGYILNAKDDAGEFVFKNKLYALWHKEEQTYRDMLKAHIGKHLDLLYKGF